MENGKYELLKIVDTGAGPNAVEKEHMTTNNWRDVVEFIKNSQETTNALGLHIRFNALPYRDMATGTIQSVMLENKLDSLLNVSLKRLKEYTEAHDYQNWKKDE